MVAPKQQALLMDNILKVNLTNFVTVGLIAFVFVYVVNWIAQKYIPVLAISATPASSSSGG